MRKALKMLQKMMFTQFELYRKGGTVQSTPECITAESAVMSHRHTAGPEGRRRTTSAAHQNRCQYPELERFLHSRRTTVLRQTTTVRVDRTGSTNPVRVLSHPSSFGGFSHFMTLQTNHRSGTKVRQSETGPSCGWMWTWINIHLFLKICG